MNHPSSPCTGVCRIDEASDYCRGCKRTLAEIAGWTGFSAREKRDVLTRLRQRRGR